MTIKRIIELVAPGRLLNFKGEAQIETAIGDMVRCECCSGEGGKYIDSRCTGFDQGNNEGNGYYEACKMCNGSGIIQPFVTIEWKAAGGAKEQYKKAIK